MKAIEIELFDYAYSPIDNKHMESQRILNPDIKPKIKIFGKRIIKKEKNYESIKINRIQKKLY